MRGGKLIDKDPLIEKIIRKTDKELAHKKGSVYYLLEWTKLFLYNLNSKENDNGKLQRVDRSCGTVGSGNETDED